MTDRPPAYDPPPHAVPEFETWFDAQTGRWCGQHQVTGDRVEATTFAGLEVRAAARRGVIKVRRAAANLAALRDPRAPWRPRGVRAGRGRDTSATPGTPREGRPST